MRSYTGAVVREPAFESIEGMTQAQFARWAARHEGDLGKHELLNGRVVMAPPAGYPHGGVGLRLGGRLVAWLERDPVGLGFESSQGFELPSGDTVQPDLSFVSFERWRAAPTPRRGQFPRVVPDVVFEILSRSTRSRDRGEKKAIYARNGVREYWLVDPRAGRLVRFCRKGRSWDHGAVFESDTTPRSVVLPGLSIDVGALFQF